MRVLPVFHNPELTTPREMPAAVLTCGRKKAGGGMVPGSTERFWIGMATGADRNTPRKGHPAFSAFNDRTPPRDGLVLPQAFMRCLLVHDDVDQARKIDRGVYRGDPKDPRVKNPPHQGSWCSGDGHRAARWDGKDYEDIECPNLDCPFAQGADPACKVRISVLFYPRWDGTPFEGDGMPQVLMKYVSKGRRMLEAFEGMLHHAQAQAKSFGVEIKSWHGFPYAMTIATRTAPGKRYTDVSFTPDGDLIGWLMRQRDQTRALGGAPPVGLLEAPMATDEQAGIDEDLTSLDPVGPSVKPAQVVDVTGEPWADLEAAVKDAGVGDEVAAEWGPPGAAWELNRAAVLAAVKKARTR